MAAPAARRTAAPRLAATNQTGASPSPICAAAHEETRLDATSVYGADARSQGTADFAGNMATRAIQTGYAARPPRAL
jgi:hypothetical protein